MALDADISKEYARKGFYDSGSFSLSTGRSLMQDLGYKLRSGLERSVSGVNGFFDGLADKITYQNSQLAYASDSGMLPDDIYNGVVSRFGRVGRTTLKSLKEKGLNLMQAAYDGVKNIGERSVNLYESAKTALAGSFKKNTGKKGKDAFTLIELLVVISIIAILAGILLPSLKGARDKAKGVVCINNLQNIYKGVVMYYQDWDKIPQYGSSSVAVQIIKGATDAPLALGLLVNDYGIKPKTLGSPENSVRTQDKVEADWNTGGIAVYSAYLYGSISRGANSKLDQNQATPAILVDDNNLNDGGISNNGEKNHICFFDGSIAIKNNTNGRFDHTTTATSRETVMLNADMEYGK